MHRPIPSNTLASNRLTVTRPQSTVSRARLGFLLGSPCRVSPVVALPFGPNSVSFLSENLTALLERILQLHPTVPSSPAPVTLQWSLVFDHSGSTAIVRQTAATTKVAAILLIMFGSSMSAHSSANRHRDKPWHTHATHFRIDRLSNFNLNP